MKNGLSAGNKECKPKKENRPNLSLLIRFNLFSVRKIILKKHKDKLTGHFLHFNIFVGFVRHLDKKHECVWILLSCQNN